MGNHDLTQKPPQDENWQGYTLEDLKYRRAYVAARRQLEKERLMRDAGLMKNGTVSSVANATKRITASIPYVNYALLAFNLGSKLWKVAKNLRGTRKKKK